MALERTYPDLTSEKDSLLLLLRDAIVQHAPHKDIEMILNAKNLCINGSIRRGLRPLHYAVFENDIESVRLIIEHGSDVNVLDEAGYSPLHLAAKYGFIDIIHMLVENACIVNFHKQDDLTVNLVKHYSDVLIEPLSLALENSHIDCARYLLCSGADPNQQYFLGYEINLLSYENLASLELILKHGANPDALSRSGITPLIKACKEGNCSAVELLLKYSCNVNYVTRKFRQRNAIVIAIESRRIDILEKLLLHAGFVNKHPSLNNSPLELAIRKDDVDIVRLLVGMYNTQTVFFETNDDIECITPLILACQCSNLKHQYEIIKCLLQNDADPNRSVANSPHHHHQHVPYRTPLVSYIKHAQRSDIRIIRLLISYGAKISFSRGRDSVLRFLRRFQDNYHLINLLCDAAYYFHPSYIAECLELDDKTKNEIYNRAISPMTLKNTLRKVIRFEIINKKPTPRIEQTVKTLPISVHLKNYLLFDAV
ncbi:unnamed protein product [Didymodactylos carnosus]|uniref:Ankyrin repeat protein n=1 Tax=Didymodactylos carnosus TaxID=1234261 RepID=A0A814LEK1_9BILA|nr:unnamed protein product [Didymodactylos carnosus]CAF1542500.1 unnamed protein product [Didymodactylos carnosus]CAF3832890.1 unnamed protein product [Didymodactylos carnosus]CAF4331174.1 unnamed protein product [Didymodactylos carnosus]